MKLSDAVVILLTSYARRSLTRGIHPEELGVYKQGMEDGQTILAQEMLDQLKPEDPVVIPAEESE